MNLTFVEQPLTVTVVDEDTFILRVVNETVVRVADVSAQGPAGPAGPPGVLPMFSRSGQVEPLVGANRFYVEFPMTVTKVRASLGTAPQGSPVVVDVNKNGLSILGGIPVTVAAGQFTHTVTTSVAVAAGDYLTVDIDAVGSTTPGSDLTVTITME